VSRLASRPPDRTVFSQRLKTLGSSRPRWTAHPKYPTITVLSGLFGRRSQLTFRPADRRALRTQVLSALAVWRVPWEARSTFLLSEVRGCCRWTPLPLHPVTLAKPSRLLPNILPQKALSLATTWVTNGFLPREWPREQFHRWSLGGSVPFTLAPDHHTVVSQVGVVASPKENLPQHRSQIPVSSPSNQ